MVFSSLQELCLLEGCKAANSSSCKTATAVHYDEKIVAELNVSRHNYEVSKSKDDG